MSLAFSMQPLCTTIPVSDNKHQSQVPFNEYFKYCVHIQLSLTQLSVHTYT